jgi:hypothetical protein
MLSQEQKDRLNSDQLAIAERWDREAEQNAKAIEKLDKAIHNSDNLLYKEALEDLNSMLNITHCEHERSIWSTCSACNEIEHLLNPEFYDKNGDRLSEEEIEAIILKANKSV